MKLQFLRLNHVLEKTTLSKTDLWDKISKDEFPAPFKLGERTRVWDEYEVDLYMHFIKTAPEGISFKCYLKKYPNHETVKFEKLIYEYEENNHEKKK